MKCDLKTYLNLENGNKIVNVDDIHIYNVVAEHPFKSYLHEPPRTCDECDFCTVALMHETSTPLALRFRVRRCLHLGLL